MLDATEPALTDITDITFDETEVAAFRAARLAGDGLRRSFDAWVSIGKATEIARHHADLPGGTQRIRGARFRAILDREGLQWFKRNDAAQILRLMERLPAVVAWRATLTDTQRLRWASPLSVLNRCPAIGRLGGPPVPHKALSLSEALKMPADDFALLLYRRCPAKMFALMRAMQALAATGSVVKPVSGWASQRAQAAAQGAV